MRKPRIIRTRRLANMSEIDPRADAPLVDWSDLGVSGLLPTGTVTLVLADVEGSTRLYEIQPVEMTATFARLDHALGDLVSAPIGYRSMPAQPIDYWDINLEFC
jgi:class 3 adenylate cyclase